MKIRVISFLLFILFGVFMYWQFNDPDRIQWIAIYGLIALISLLRLFNIFSRPLSMIIMIALLIYSLFFIPSVIEWLGKPDKSEIFGQMIYDRPYIEETREFFGLIIGFLGMLLHYRSK